MLHRRSSSIALLLGLLILSPSLVYGAISAFSGVLGCHLDSSLSSGCIIGDRDYSILMYRLGPYANLSMRVFEYWLSLTLIWMAIGLYESRRVKKIVAIIIGGAPILAGIFNALSWAFGLRYDFLFSALSLLQLLLNDGLVIGVFGALVTFAIRNGFEIPPQKAEGAAE